MGHIRLGVKQPLTVAPDVTVHAAARAMADRNVGAAGVVENDRLVGIITERDVLRRVVAAGSDPMGARVANVMSSPVISVTLNTSVADAATIMRSNHIRHLAVLGADGKLTGILALQYVLYDLLDDFERNVGDLMGFIMADSPGG
jgi:CBS domain-containing protein